jgi:ankyrin repeat protein/HEAT repeat protein
MNHQAAVWFLPGEGEQNAGPFSSEEVIQQLQFGEITPTTLCWREGMADWQPLADVEPFTSITREGRSSMAPPPTLAAIAAIPEAEQAAQPKKPARLPTFWYAGRRRADGQKATGTIEARDQAEAISLIEKAGVVPSRIERADFRCADASVSTPRSSPNEAADSSSATASAAAPNAQAERTAPSRKRAVRIAVTIAAGVIVVAAAGYWAYGLLSHGALETRNENANSSAVTAARKKQRWTDKQQAEIARSLVMLKSDDASFRTAAAVTLARLPDPRATDLLIEALRDTNPDVRAAAASALRQQPDPRAVKPLVAMLGEKNWGSGDAASAALAAIGSPAVEQLLSALSDDDELVRVRSAKALGTIGDSRAVEGLISGWRRADGATSGVFFEALKSMGSPAVPAVIALVESRDAKVLEEAVKLLGAMGDTRAVEPLLQLLTETKQGERTDVAMALGELRDPRAIPALIAALKDEHDGGHALIAGGLIAGALEQIARQSFRDNIRDEVNRWLAWWEQNQEVVALLVNNGGWDYAGTCKEFLPLHMAAAAGSGRAVVLLMERKFDVNGRDADGCAPLHYGAMSGKREVVLALLNAGAGINAKNAKGYTPLVMATRGDHRDMVACLIAKGGDVSAKAEDGLTPLHAAVSCGAKVVWYPSFMAEIGALVPQARTFPVDDGELVRMLLKHGANPNVATDREGATPLHMAVLVRHRAAAEALLAGGADPNTRAMNSDHGTALHIASRQGDLDMAELLLKHGADVNAKTMIYGTTPLRSAHTDEMKELLRWHGAR